MPPTAMPAIAPGAKVDVGVDVAVVDVIVVDVGVVVAVVAAIYSRSQRG